MEPQSPSLPNSPEHGPAHFSGGETFPGAGTPEVAPKLPERGETHEQHTGGPAGDPASVVHATPVLPPLPTIAPVQSPKVPAAVGAAPATAADEDLIEKEWVEKAKKVVAETKHDPYLQGQEVSRLQADYLKKRYGKSVKLPQDGS